MRFDSTVAIALIEDTLKTLSTQMVAVYYPILSCIRKMVDFEKKKK